ncbi:hypothetical protein [Nocardia macrotermitis]|uniref:Uncharacterized protein n=1 Tax=Nocardia macrotermitis TaxID=2585198 RepID=A0A7K0DFE2_9NOCA|nr:hypothetical protein [Nocardia macrotermitis]MQY24398.1 hypothetical protein [Nocardia macrotermitis]
MIGVNLDFEVFVLMGMTCDKSVKREALERIGVSWDAAEVTKESIGDLLQVNSRQFESLVRLLDATSVVAGSDVLSYRPALWPEFDIAVTADHGYWDSVRFVRKSGLQVPKVSKPEELGAWSVTVRELGEMFGPLEDGDHWPPYEEFLFETMAGERYGAGFSWGLIQDVERLESVQGSAKL